MSEDWGWGEKPPTSHNDSLVVGTRRAGAREDPPTSVVNSLVAVGVGEDRGWGEQATNKSYLLVVVVKREGQGWGK